jgi:hypothetical protein
MLFLDISLLDVAGSPDMLEAGVAHAVHAV